MVPIRQTWASVVRSITSAMTLHRGHATQTAGRGAGAARDRAVARDMAAGKLQSDVLAAGRSRCGCARCHVRLHWG